MNQDRTKHIGGSDAAAILGLNPYRTAHQVWLRKTGREPEQPTNLAMRIGQLAEPMIASLYEEQTGTILEPARFVQHARLPFVGGTPDRLVRGDALSVEIKTASIRTADRWGEDGTDEVPEEYLIQVQVYLSLLDHDRADLAVLLGGSDFRVYHLLRDRELEGEILERLARFWRDHVQADKPPAVDGGEGAREMLARLYPHDGPEMLPPSPEADALAAEYVAARQAREAWETRESVAKQRLQGLIGDRRGVDTKHGRALWTVRRGRVLTDWPEVAKAAGATPQLIQAHTHFGKEVRAFTFKTSKEK